MRSIVLLWPMPVREDSTPSLDACGFGCQDICESFGICDTVVFDIFSKYSNDTLSCGRQFDCIDPAISLSVVAR